MLRLGIAAGLLLTALGAAASNFGSSAAGTTAADFLDLGAGARAMGMGGAYSAAADDAAALYWNPAAMTQVAHRSATLMHAAYIASSYYDYGSYVENAGRYGAFGLGVQYFSFGKVYETDQDYIPIGTVTPYDLAASVGYAYQLESGFALGAAGKFIQSKLADTANTEAVDLGVLSPRFFDDRLRLAVTARNLGGTLKYDQAEESLPLAFKAGAAFHITKDWLTALDVGAPKNDSPYADFGTEYLLAVGDFWRFAGRAGFSSQNLSPSVGIGVGCKTLSVDYAFVPYNYLGDVHRVSLTFSF
ncbi:MAG: PorV/PorQ family protein [Elusimicrobia bacterium]|nr:PorV/PorQ family protein [Elusimicrobiota bacterium]